MMDDNLLDSLTVLLLLGAFHGINPGMGWLFAVALGLQEGRSRAVWRALLPLAAGHALAIAAAVVVALAVGAALPAGSLKLPVAAALIGLGGYRLFRHRHPRYGGMRMGMAELSTWSFLMASAHGAGLMVLPVFLGMTGTTVQAAGVNGAHGAHAPAAAISDPAVAVAATIVHSAGYLLVTAVVAWIVYTWVGVGLLRKAWLNLDQVWAAALIVSGGVTLVL